MNERLETLLTYLETTVKTAGEFAVEQAPEVVEEILEWALYKASLELVLSIAFTYGAFRLLMWPKKNWDYLVKNDIEPICVVPILFGFMGAVACPLIAIDQIYIILQVLVAPRLYLLEYASNLVK